MKFDQDNEMLRHPCSYPYKFLYVTLTVARGNLVVDKIPRWPCEYCIHFGNPVLPYKHIKIGVQPLRLQMLANVYKRFDINQAVLSN